MLVYQVQDSMINHLPNPLSAEGFSPEPKTLKDLNVKLVPA